MKEPKVSVSIWFDLLVAIITFIIYVKFPDAPPYISLLPGIGAILLSITLFLIRNHFYKMHIEIVKQYQKKLNNLNKEIRLNNAIISKYDDMVENIIKDFFNYSIILRDETEKEIFTKLYTYVNNSYNRLLTETNRKKVDIHEDSKDH